MWRLVRDGSRTRFVSHTTIAVGVLALLLASLEVAARYTPHTWIFRDGRFYTNVNVTLVEGASLDQGEFCASWYQGNLGWNRNLDAAWSNVALGRNGEHLPKHPILLPILSTPLFWAFGLHGTLLFNLLVFLVAGAALFSVARRYGSMPAAIFAALGLLSATNLREHAYDYPVDTLMVALFASGLACVHAGRMAWAAILIGATVVLRPTALLWLPSVVLIVIEQRDWRALARAMIIGSIPLVLYAISNTWLYGRPWWSGYNRTLIVVDGVAQVADHSDAFGVPFAEGLEILWAGPEGIRHRLTLMAAAIPGLVLLVRRRPLYVLAAVFGTVASIALFATYRWYADRFLWPSCALLVPALAVTFDAIGRSLSRWPAWRPSLVAALSCVAIVLAHAVTVGPPLEARSDEALGIIAIQLVALGGLAVGLTRAAQRTGAGVLSIAAPIALVLLPGVRERVLENGTDVFFAACVCLAIGAQRWQSALAWSAFAGVVILTHQPGESAFTIDPGRKVEIGLFCVSAIALFALGRRVWLVLPLLLLFVPRVAGVAGGMLPLFAFALLVLPIPHAIARASIRAIGAWNAATRARRLTVLGSALAALFVAGLVPRVIPTDFRIASYEALRSADVFLGEVPCDFLAWEHLNWECATFDQGVHGETGLATSAPLHVAGEALGMFLITNQRGRSRLVRWTGVRAGDALALRYAVPDELTGGGTLIARVDGRDVGAVALPTAPDGQVRYETFNTKRWRGRDVTLELQLRGGNAVVLDGEFVETDAAR